ncbi:MAG: electron transfer flavoprotein subunit alpha [Planctomycetes bacterium DG_23]|nr:MAG: electron transfer flavoprotein subunit alpha [Planctomycetes bacterium DG_23]
MADAPKVWVVAETSGSGLSEVSLELLSKASELAGKLKTGVAAALVGYSIEPLAPELISYGADVVFLAQDERLKDYLANPYAKIIARLLAEEKPEIVLYGASSTGRDLAPRVASQIRAGLTADCTDLKIGDHKDLKTGKVYRNILFQVRPAFGGNIIATIVNLDHRPQMSTVREGVMRMSQPQASRRGEVIEVPVELSPEDFLVEVLERVEAQRKVNLKGANIIVSGGAGVGSRENFRLIHEFAEVLDAEVGASRAAVDAGFVSKEHQVGQTGTTVRPKLYIACGISGSVQHQAGMSEAGKILAINTDPEAPIMNIAHYKIIGDLNEVIPQLIKTHKASGR